MNELLAQKMKPKTLNDVVGQKHLIGENKVLSNLVKNGKIFSMILYGPPGIGKTSIANALVNDLGCHYRFLNATINNKKDFDAVVEEAKMLDGIVLVMDEIHRLNKDKQDLLLPQLESGLITLIGMTTSNPYHSINPAIRSRCQLYELKPLSVDDIISALNNVIAKKILPKIKIDQEAIEHIAKISGSDLRYAYNLLEVAYYSTNDQKIDIDLLKKINNKPSYISDKDGDGHYDLLSAFQKSIRGSDVDAALHYLGRLIEFGDLDSIYRRMSVICYEDIGLANPNMGPRVMAAISASELVGLPEARIPLGEIVIELALSPKSNTAITAINMALKDIEEGNIGSIPDVIKINTTTYKYPHNFPGSFVVQQYMPDNLLNRHYYTPKNSGYEINLKQIYERIEKLKKEKPRN